MKQKQKTKENKVIPEQELADKETQNPTRSDTPELFEVTEGKC